MESSSIVFILRKIYNCSKNYNICNIVSFLSLIMKNQIYNDTFEIVWCKTVINKYLLPLVINKYFVRILECLNNIYERSSKPYIHASYSRNILTQGKHD